MKAYLAIIFILVLVALGTSSAVCTSCLDKGDCPGSLDCIEGVCEDCNEPAECEPGQLCVDGECLNCQEHAECPEGFSCFEGRCVEPELAGQATYRLAFLPLVVDGR